MTKSLTSFLSKFSCFCDDTREDCYYSVQDAALHEKLSYQPLTESPSLTADEAAHETLTTLMISEKSGRTLQITIDEIVAQAGGWAQAIAYKILKLLEYALNSGIPMGVAMKEAYDKSLSAAEDLTTFAKDHPFFCTLVALGILMILAPAVVSALGFTSGGVLEGSVAASWQSTYGGYIEAGSLFSYLQKLGTLVGVAKL